MVKFITSSICGNTSEIFAEIKKDHVNISINSTCKKIMDYSLSIKELYLKDVFTEIIKNKAYIKASEAKLCPTCLVPCGVVYASWTEFGLISKNLLSKFPSQCILFKQ
ncbi:MAG: hypothetical protein DSO09_04710 [Candidatus Methanomethylicota archaeon]|jgi:hypothetical protein|uniref:Uncharacterized protein n=1 Tax=Thermoproteota archaeon TaxID=2056631 RepID=A0A523BBR1_9CREN|nr:MAG: hypothetical protein EF809_01620 [Candidatus Verstraetearchaeota archaeon]TDA38314.1 MAG: hypothetical protein DSO09_04710 [Candidatus Verstraetearchaeota archaeon]